MKQKIVFFLPNLNGGGAERVAVNMIRQLDSEKYHIYLLLVQRVGEYFDDIPSYVEIIDLGVKKTILSIYKLRKEIKEIQPDVVFSTLYRTSVAIDLALIGEKKKPKIIFRNPTSPKLVIEEKSLGFIMKKLLEKSYRNADIILAQTPEMKEEISLYHHIDREKIKVYLNPLDTDSIDNKIRDIENPFTNEKINIVAAGRLSNEKGYDILLEALSRVVKKNNQYFLHILGNDGGEEWRLRNIVKLLQLETYVKFWGFQNNPYKFFYFSDLYVLPSRREGLPNTVLENLYLEKPIIATNCIPYMYTLIKDNKNGFIVDVENIEDLAKSILNFNLLKTETFNFMEKNSINDLFEVFGK